MENLRTMVADIKRDRDIYLLRRVILEKWAKVSVGLKTNYGAGDCHLCREYHKSFFADPLVSTNLEYENDCVGCPVMHKTGAKYCKLSPYDKIVDMEDEFYTEAEYKEASNEMLMFLQGLLEELKYTGTIKRR